MQKTRSNGVKLEKLYSGKTKDVFLQDDGNVLLYFKDAVTGAEGRIDSGANEVIGEVEGKGNASLRLTVHFFHLLQKAGIPTHFSQSRPERKHHHRKACTLFQPGGYLQRKGMGSFVRRYGKYAKEACHCSLLWNSH